MTIEWPRERTAEGSDIIKGETMKCWNAVSVAGASIATISLFVTVLPSATAGPDKVAFPAYQTHLLYDVLDKPEDKEIMEFYVNPEALKHIKSAQPLPSGTTLTRPTFKAVLDEKGELEIGRASCRERVLDHV